MSIESGRDPGRLLSLFVALTLPAQPSEYDTARTVAAANGVPELVETKPTTAAKSGFVSIGELHEPTAIASNRQAPDKTHLKVLFEEDETKFMNVSSCIESFAERLQPLRAIDCLFVKQIVVPDTADCRKVPRSRGCWP